MAVLYTVVIECNILIFKLFCTEGKNSKQHLLPLIKKQTYWEPNVAQSQVFLCGD